MQHKKIGCTNWVQEIGCKKLGAPKIGCIEKLGATTKLGATKLGATKLGATKSGATKLGATKLGATKLGATKLGATKLGAILVNLLKYCETAFGCKAV